MYQYKYVVIVLYVISAVNIRTNAQSSIFSNIHKLNRKKEVIFRSGELQFPAPKNASDLYELYFGVLLPAEKTRESRCSYNEALPAMELAIRKLQQPGGLFEEFNIFVEFRDTKSSTTYCSLAAVDLYTKQSPG